MKSWNRLVRVVSAIGIVFFVGIAGVLAGNLVSHLGAGAKQGTQTNMDVREIEAQAQERLERCARGLTLGEPFPEMWVWTIDAAERQSVHDVLPHGGVVMLFSTGCASCIDEIVSLDRLIKQIGRDAKSVMLLADRQSGASQIADELKQVGVDLPLYCDLGQMLRDEYNVITRTAFFDIAPDGVLRSLIGWREDPSTMPQLFGGAR